MFKTLVRLHEILFIIHSDLQCKNWVLDSDNNILLCDFGCAQVLGPGGKVPAGTKVFFVDGMGQSPPEMQYEEGKSFLDSKTTDDIDFKSDVWQLAYNLQCCLFQGKWLMTNPTPKNYGEDVVALIDWIKNPDQYARPTAA